ncbi:MAG: FtsW/RodA/SpoVE family cell cycle protein [Candidatus Promineifilaceae bacterium]
MRNGRTERLLLLLVTVFIWTNAAALSLVRSGTIQWAFTWPSLMWTAVTITTHLLLSHYKPTRDPYLLPILALLTGWSILLIHRLAANFLTRQIIWVVISILAMLAIVLVPPNLRLLRRFRYTWLLLGLALLGATLLFGVNPAGAKSAFLWLPIPFLGNVFFQPSELLKLLLIVFLASYFEDRGQILRVAERNGRLGPLPYLAPLLLMWGFCMILLIWQQDLGAATLFFIVFLALLYMATGNWRYIVSGGLLLVLASIFAYYTFARIALRVDIWLNPWPEFNDRAFQIVQSLYAIANGGLFGQGIGQGAPTFIPVVHSDFVFAAIAEEWGLIGTITIVACFLLLAFRGFRIALLAKRPFRTYLAAGITLLINTQAILIMGGVTKLLPLTGVTLPFVSYGGSSLLISSIMLGLLIHLSTDAAEAFA